MYSEILRPPKNFLLLQLCNKRFFGFVDHVLKILRQMFLHRERSYRYDTVMASASPNT